jgi:hypothetical protein
MSKEIDRSFEEVLHEAAQLTKRVRATLAALPIETFAPVSAPEVEAWSD